MTDLSGCSIFSAVLAFVVVVLLYAGVLGFAVGLLAAACAMVATWGLAWVLQAVERPR